MRGYLARILPGSREDRHMSGPTPFSPSPPERQRCQGKIEFELPEATRVSRIVTKNCFLAPLPGEIYCARHLEEHTDGVRYCHEHRQTYLTGQTCPECLPPRELSAQWPRLARRASGRQR